MRCGEDDARGCRLRCETVNGLGLPQGRKPFSQIAKPLALLYATFGQGREAVRTIERHLAQAADDVDGLALAVEWIYVLHSSGAVARTRAEDIKMARAYADAYQRLNGPAIPLIQEWVGAIEAGRR